MHQLGYHGAHSRCKNETVGGRLELAKLAAGNGGCERGGARDVGEEIPPFSE